MRNFEISVLLSVLMTMMLFSKVSSRCIFCAGIGAPCATGNECVSQFCKNWRCEVAPCLKDDDSWKDWGGESCQYYANRPLECGEYDRFSYMYPDFPATNPCCACKVDAVMKRDQGYTYDDNPKVMDSMVPKSLNEHCNWQCYLDRYADLKDAFGDDLVAAQRHWNNHGKSEGRDCTCGYYTATSGKLCSQNGDPAVDDLATCKKATRELSYGFSTTEDVAGWPKGCYLADDHEVYFNMHGYGSAHVGASQICQATRKCKRLGAMCNPSKPKECCSQKCPPAERHPAGDGIRVGYLTFCEN